MLLAVAAVSLRDIGSYDAMVIHMNIVDELATYGSKESSPQRVWGCVPLASKNHSPVQARKPAEWPRYSERAMCLLWPAQKSRIYHPSNSIAISLYNHEQLSPNTRRVTYSWMSSLYDGVTRSLGRGSENKQDRTLRNRWTPKLQRPLFQ